jgi:hypothetical protein
MLPLLVWREMTLEDAQISDTHSLKGHRATDGSKDTTGVNSNFEIPARRKPTFFPVFPGIRSSQPKHIFVQIQAQVTLKKLYFVFWVKFSKINTLQSFYVI